MGSEDTQLAFYLFNLTFGAFILILIDVWLRRRGAKDPALAWLYISLLSWIVALSLELLHLELFILQQVKYFFSILITVLWVKTAFQVSRVGQLFSPKNSRRMRWTLFVLVSGLSLSAWILLGTHYFTEAIVLDVVATCIAGVTLGTALSYSFYRHGNLFMVGVTLLTFAIFIQRQFYYSLYGRPQAGPYLWYLLVTFEFLILIFVAHALVWAFSDASRLKPLAGSPRVQVVALLFDLRGSTEWSYEVADTDSNYVKAFQDELREWSTNKVFAQPQGWPNLIKFMGDGFLFVWEIPDSSLVIYFSAIVDAAYNLCVDYRSWVKDTEFMKRFPMGVPIGIGYGVDVGQGTRITFENGSNDYLGAPVNNAAKMQDLARPHGGGVIRAKAWSLLSESLQDKFPKEGPMKIGTRTVAVRMTEEVEYKNHVPKN